jgi:hypothetical protein
VNVKSSLQFLNELNRYNRYNYFNNNNFLNIELLNTNTLVEFNLTNNLDVEKNFIEKMYLVIKQKRYLPTKKLSFF